MRNWFNGEIFIYLLDTILKCLKIEYIEFLLFLLTKIVYFLLVFSSSSKDCCYLSFSSSS
jgi:hypothetical protein